MTEEEARQILAGMGEGEAWDNIESLVELGLLKMRVNDDGSRDYSVTEYGERVLSEQHPGMLCEVVLDLVG